MRKKSAAKSLLISRFRDVHLSDGAKIWTAPLTIQLTPLRTKHQFISYGRNRGGFSISDRNDPSEGSYMVRHSLRILAQAGLSGVFFAAKILRGEIPRYRLPLPEFAANFYTRSCLLTTLAKRRKYFLCFTWIVTGLNLFHFLWRRIWHIGIHNFLCQ